MPQGKPTFYTKEGEPVWGGERPPDMEERLKKKQGEDARLAYELNKGTTIGRVIKTQEAPEEKKKETGPVPIDITPKKPDHITPEVRKKAA